MMKIDMDFVKNFEPCANCNFDVDFMPRDDRNLVSNIQSYADKVFSIVCKRDHIEVGVVLFEQNVEQQFKELMHDMPLLDCIIVHQFGAKTVDSILSIKYKLLDYEDWSFNYQSEQYGVTCIKFKYFAVPTLISKTTEKED